ncbi:MAG TPA: tryptophan--tRNA ligase [Nanoarchaeota archaeon]|nr:tryptophan--tRNA ligase [Nanoarchaeota archaeon]
MANEFKVTPWTVTGNVDYEKLTKEFGTEPLTDEILNRIKRHTKELHVLLRRKVFFSHRDMKWLLDEYEKGNKFFLYTGRGPSGPVHIGHLIPWIFTRWLQEKFDAELWFQFTDDEKFLFRKKDEVGIGEYTKIAYENALDVIALGFNPKKTHFLIDSLPETAGMMYKEAIRIADKITASTAKAAFGFDDSYSIGQFFYTAMQAVPAILPSALKGVNIPCLIPLGVDQDPHFRVARDVYTKLGFYKPALIHAKFMAGLLADGKMSASIPNSTIYTTDSPKEVEEKIKKHAFSGGRTSLEEHRKYGGNPDIDVCYQWLYNFFEPDDKKLAKIYDDYKSGKMLTSELKDYTIAKINAFLKEHQKKREKAKSQIEKFLFKA